MKNKRLESSSFALWVLIVIMIILVIAIVLLNFHVQSVSDMKSLLMSLLNSLLSAVTVGLIATTFTKVISDNMASVKRNNEKLRDYGIDFIGTGISTRKDTLNLFGNPHSGNYPKEIKLFFISGNGYFYTFRKDILECVKNSDVNIKILLVSTENDNREYLKRMEAMCPQKNSYVSQVLNETLPVLQDIVDKLEGEAKKKIRIRFYRDEYRYNFRIAKYCYGDDNVEGKCWLNIQPFSRDAIDLSVGLNGSWSIDTSSDNNIFDLLDSGFDELWERYSTTEYTFK